MTRGRISRAVAAFETRLSKTILAVTGSILDLPAIVVGDHRHRREGDLGFAGEPGLRDVGHADDVEAHLAVRLGFGAGRERGAVHVHVGAAIVDGVAARGAGAGDDVAQPGADGIGKCDMGDDTAAEEGVLRAPAGAVEELRGEHDVARLVLLLEAADCGDADDPADTERAQRVDICAVIQLMRHDAMAAAVAGQKVDLPACELAGEMESLGGPNGCRDVISEVSVRPSIW